MMSIEAVKQALEALVEGAEGTRRLGVVTLEAIIDLRQAIADFEKQEPVACQHKRYSIDVHEQTGTCYDCGAEGRMRFVVDETHPQPKREWVGLTVDEMAICIYEPAWDLVLRKAEQILKEKNT